MMLDTEIRLNGEAANEFHNMMRMVDLDSINERDRFVSNVSCQFDEKGVLSINIEDLNVDLGDIDESLDGIETVAVPKEETYVGEISVQFLSSTNINFNTINERKTSYTVDKYYTSTDMYSINQSVSIKFAA